jgi:Domain of unknown function (DUF5668)
VNSSSSELIRAVRGPLLLITLGLLFVADHFGPFPFYKTWPVLLIVFGALKLAERLFAGVRSATPAGDSV